MNEQTDECDKNKLNIDDIIKLLLSVKKEDANLVLTMCEIQNLCNQAGSILAAESTLLKIESPVMIVGDIHGQFLDLLRLFERGNFPLNSSYLFLGDYVDRGKQSIETMCLLLAYKIKYPNLIFLLRGNHECGRMNKRYGFYGECIRRCNKQTFKVFRSIFNLLPLAAVVNGKYFCVHGGLSPELETLDDILCIQRPLDVPFSGLIKDILWTDPGYDRSGWSPSSRPSYYFGSDILEEFLNKNELTFMIRAHQFNELGFRYFGDGKLVTIFSAPNYKGYEQNKGAMLFVNKDLICEIIQVKPRKEKFLKRMLGCFQDQ